MSEIEGFNQDARGMASSIESIIHFCSDVNVGTGPMDECLAKTVVANMQYVQRDKLYSHLFGEKSYIHWDLVNTLQKRCQSKKRGNPVGDSVTWCYLFKFLYGDIPPFQVHSVVQQNKVLYRPFYIVYDAIMGQFKGELKTTDPASLSLVIKAFFITNIIGITPISALEHLLSKHFGKTVTNQSTAIMIMISSEKFTPEQYSDTIYWLFKNGIVKVDIASMDKEIQFHYSKGKEVKDVMKVYSMQVSRSGRPSLISIVKEVRAKRGQRMESGCCLEDGTTYQNYFTFSGFTNRMRFPNSLSIYIQQRAYWLASQGEFFAWRDYAHDFLHKDLAKSLLEYGDIQSPDPSIIAEVLMNTRIVGAPFKALQTFRNKCLVSMPGLERMDMTMNDVFRLYVASYQNKDIWKDVWKLIKPILSTQIIKDVEHFVALNPMDCYSTASVIMYGSCEPPEGAMMRGSIVKNSDLGVDVSDSVSVQGGVYGGDETDHEIDPSDSISNVGVSQIATADIATRASNNRHNAVAMAAALVKKKRQESEKHSQVST